MSFEVEDLQSAMEKISDAAIALFERGRDLLEDWGVIEKRRRAWPWVTALIAAGAVGTFFALRRARESGY